MDASHSTAAQMEFQWDRATPTEPHDRELWRPLKGRPGYEVSSLGRVRSWWVQGSPGKGAGKGFVRVIGDSPKIINPWLNGNGYPVVSLHHGGGHGRQRKVLVHRAVLEAFVGPCPPGMVACHDPDPAKINCRLDNLRWDTRRGNSLDALRCRDPDAHKITEGVIPDIWARLVAGESPPSIARRYKVHVSAISFIKQGRTWAHITRDLPGDVARRFPKPESTTPISAPREIIESEEEIWRPVSRAPGYSVSNFGRIRGISGKILAQPSMKNGYLSVSFAFDAPGGRKRLMMLTHSVVLEAFAGPRPKGMVACHGLEGRTCNHVRNLRWDTRRANFLDYLRERPTR